MAADVWIKNNTAKMTVYPLATISAKAFYVFKLNTVGTSADLIIMELLIPFICFLKYKRKRFHVKQLAFIGFSLISIFLNPF